MKFFHKRNEKHTILGAIKRFANIWSVKRRIKVNFYIYKV